jgi:hypothetical protein
MLAAPDDTTAAVLFYYLFDLKPFVKVIAAHNRRSERAVRRWY